jgi:hypothetical protein
MVAHGEDGAGDRIEQLRRGLGPFETRAIGDIASSHQNGASGEVGLRAIVL